MQCCFFTVISYNFSIFHQCIYKSRCGPNLQDVACFVASGSP